ncbi:MAG: hypothetical protein ACREJP_10120 [Candidatus Methylomirabilales bacterium]
MNRVLLLLLALLWGAVVIPTLLRARQETSPIVSVRIFRRRMRVLGGDRRPRVGGRWILVPRSLSDLPSPRRRSLERRRLAFFGLLGAAAATLALGMVPSLDALIKVHILVDGMLAGYVLVLLKMKERRPSRRAPSHLTEPPAFVEPGPRRYASAGRL